MLFRLSVFLVFSSLWAAFLVGGFQFKNSGINARV